MTKLEKAAFKIDKLGDWNVSINRKIARFFAKKITRYNEFVMDEKIYKKIRDLTDPLHWVWINKWLSNLKKNWDENPFKKEGLYIITGLPGSGKSSLAAELMHRDLMRTGKGSYINTKIENPRIDEITRQKYLLHPRYEFTDFFNNREIVAYPNHYKFAALHIDEIHQILQYRNNSGNEYMNLFKGFMDYVVGVRQYIGHIYAYTQMNKVDIQMLTMAEAIVEVQVKKGFDYELWRETGKMEITILGWNLIFYKPEITSSGFTKTEYKRFFLERTMDLKYFNTMNLRDAAKSANFDNRYNNQLKEVNYS